MRVKRSYSVLAPAATVPFSLHTGMLTVTAVVTNELIRLCSAAMVS